VFAIPDGDGVPGWAFIDIVPVHNNDTYRLTFIKGGYWGDYSEDHLTLTPTWEQEFGNTEEGRKKLALALVEAQGKRAVDVLDKGCLAWDTHILEPCELVDCVMMRSLLLPLHNYRFAPETADDV